ncbi:MAG: helix-turn-helix transcriptional regulator [Ethanoligenens sp.]
MRKLSFAPRNLVVGTTGTGMTRGEPYLTTDSKAGITKHIGQEIQYYRKKAGYTQDDLAEKIGKVRRTIQKYEKGDVAVPVPTLNEISKVLNVPLLALTGHHFNGSYEVPIGKNMYEVELETDQVKVFRQIGEDEYLKWYIDDSNISRRGEIRRLFLMEIPLEKAADMVVRSILFSKTANENGGQ